MKNTWGEARAICRSFDMELTTIETLIEAKSFLALADNHSHFRSENGAWIAIDGTTLTSKSTTDWYWPKTGRKISFPIPWLPGQPDNVHTNEFCFGIGREFGHQKFGYNDMGCSGSVAHFICQRFEISIP